MWYELQFGEHRGKMLPQVIWSDPDWFFWAFDQGVFKGQLGELAWDLYDKARNIRIGEDLEARYTFDQWRGFTDLEIVPRCEPGHWDFNRSLNCEKKDCIDLGYPRELAPYLRTCCKGILPVVKHYLFESEDFRMTKKRCESFFEQPEAFVSVAENGAVTTE